VPAEAPSLLPLFRSDQQALILAEVFFGEPRTGASLSRKTGLAQTTVSRELNRLRQAGLVRVEQVGRTNLVHPNMDLPYAPALRQLLAYAAGVPHLVLAEYADVADISEIFIHGSWAARYRGEDGPPPNDLDLVIVSSTHTRFTLAEHRAALEQATGMEVDQLVVPPDHERLERLRKNSMPVLTPETTPPR